MPLPQYRLSFYALAMGQNPMLFARILPLPPGAPWLGFVGGRVKHGHWRFDHRSRSIEEGGDRLRSQLPLTPRFEPSREARSRRNQLADDYVLLQSHQVVNLAHQ